MFAVLFVNRERLINWRKNESVKLFIFSLLFIFTSLIPFLGLGNISERYSYLASIGFAFLLVTILRSLSDFFHNEKYRAYFLVTLTILLGSWFYFQNTAENAEWKEAGRITQRTLGYLRLYYNGNHPNANFYFVNVPIRKANAWIFPVGLSDGIWFIYRDDSISSA